VDLRDVTLMCCNCTDLSVTRQASQLTIFRSLSSITEEKPASQMAKTETLNLRVSGDFKRRLAQEAAKERRSVTNYLEVVLTGIWNQNEAPVQKKGEKPARK
jgi:predicted HicB family RNase H-like nuclease